MMIGHIQGATRVLGKSQGYLGLPVRDAVVNSTVTGPNTPVMETAWIPTPDELQRIVCGAPIILQLVSGDPRHPPVMMFVGDIPS